MFGSEIANLFFLFMEFLQRARTSVLFSSQLFLCCIYTRRREQSYIFVIKMEEKKKEKNTTKESEVHIRQRYIFNNQCAYRLVVVYIRPFARYLKGNIICVEKRCIFVISRVAAGNCRGRANCAARQNLSRRDVETIWPALE